MTGSHAYWLTIDTLAAVLNERRRQDKLKAEGRFRHTCADAAMADADRLAVLGEEFGEVCRALAERRKAVSDTHGSDLHSELIQVAAVAVAWAEAVVATELGKKVEALG